MAIETDKFKTYLKGTTDVNVGTEEEKPGQLMSGGATPCMRKTRGRISLSGKDKSRVHFDHIEMLGRHPSGVLSMQINQKSGAQRRCFD